MTIGIDPGVLYAGITYGSPWEMTGVNLRLLKGIRSPELIAEQHLDYIIHIHQNLYYFKNINLELVDLPDENTDPLLRLACNSAIRLHEKLIQWGKQQADPVLIKTYSGFATSRRRKSLRFYKTTRKGKASRMAHANDAIALLVMNMPYFTSANKPKLRKFNDIKYEDFCLDDLPYSSSKAYRHQVITYLKSNPQTPDQALRIKALRIDCPVKSDCIIQLNDAIQINTSFSKKEKEKPKPAANLHSKIHKQLTNHPADWEGLHELLDQPTSDKESIKALSYFIENPMDASSCCETILSHALSERGLQEENPLPVVAQQLPTKNIPTPPPPLPSPQPSDNIDLYITLIGLAIIIGTIIALSI